MKESPFCVFNIARIIINSQSLNMHFFVPLLGINSLTMNTQFSIYEAINEADRTFCLYMVKKTFYFVL